MQLLVKRCLILQNLCTKDKDSMNTRTLPLSLFILHTIYYTKLKLYKLIFIENIVSNCAQNSSTHRKIVIFNRYGPFFVLNNICHQTFVVSSKVIKSLLIHPVHSNLSVSNLLHSERLARNIVHKGELYEAIIYQSIFIR